MPELMERDQEEQSLLGAETYEGPSARSVTGVRWSRSRSLVYYLPLSGVMMGLLVLCIRRSASLGKLQTTRGSQPEQKYITPPAPSKVTDYNGVEWPPMTVPGHEKMHFFIIGDWGGLDGFIDPPIGGKMVMYSGGEKPGPHVFAHRPSGCTDGEMSLCFNARGAHSCAPNCGYNDTVDHDPQYLVADQMKLRAKKTPPKFILNVGDNFYWGGVPITCGTQPMAGVHWTTAHMFDTIFRQIYNSHELQNVVWLSVLGNHDYGGWSFTSGWDQQIAFTWHDPRWRLPAQYWKQHVGFPDQDFTIDILLTDSNAEDAVDPAARPTTNICGCQHNSPGASCASVGGPKSLADCPMYFAKLWQEQMVWVEKQLKASEATWQVIVTHFPCGHQPAYYNHLHVELGLDFLVTGHTHIQEVNQLGGLLCVISGGGGGILSEVAPQGDKSNSYGFYDAAINRTHLVVESVNFFGHSLGVWTAAPVPGTVREPAPKPPPEPARVSTPEPKQEPTQEPKSEPTPAKKAEPHVALTQPKPEAEAAPQHLSSLAAAAGPGKPPKPPKECAWCHLLR